MKPAMVLILALVAMAMDHAPIISPAWGARMLAPKMRPFFGDDGDDHAFGAAFGAGAVIVGEGCGQANRRQSCRFRHFHGHTHMREFGSV